MIKIVTCNIRTSTTHDGINNFFNRTPIIREVIERSAPDIVGFQEMKPEMQAAMRALMPNYTFIGTGRGRTLDDESNCIAVKTDAYELCATDTFWLSPTPHVPGSRYEMQSGCPRIMTWARLYDRTRDEFIWIINTHLDHEYTEAREAGLKQVLDCAHGLKAQLDIPIFITGDFNFTPNDPEYAQIERSGFNDLTTGLTDSFHGFGRVKGEKIDYILTDQPADHFTIETWHECREGIYFSDHDAICAVWNRA